LHPRQVQHKGIDPKQTPEEMGRRSQQGAKSEIFGEKKIQAGNVKTSPKDGQRGPSADLRRTAGKA